MAESHEVVDEATTDQGASVKLYSRVGNSLGLEIAGAHFTVDDLVKDDEFSDAVQMKRDGRHSGTIYLESARQATGLLVTAAHYL